MSSARKLLGASGLYTLATVAPTLTMLLVTPVVTRVLGAEQYGRVAVGISIYQLIAALGTLGLATAITRHAILLDNGSRGAAGVVVYGSAATALVGFLWAALMMWAGASLFPGVGPLLLVFSTVAGCGLGIVNLAQAILRADEKVFLFLLTSIAAALIPPAFGLLLLLQPQWRGSATIYTVGLAIGYGLVALGALGIMWWQTPPVLHLRAFGDALVVGLPTLPHTAAVPLLSTAIVAIAASTSGVTTAGQLQTVAMLGTSVITVMNAANNAWAPMVMKSNDADRPAFLRSTTYVIAVAAMSLIAGFVVVAPVAVPLVGGPLVTDSLPIHASMVIASSGAFHAAYLANIHMTFISGRTWPLAISTPGAAIVSLGVLWTSLKFVDPRATLMVLALAWPLFYLLQAVFSYVLARWSPYPANNLGRSAIPLVIAIIIVIQGISFGGQPWTSIAATLLALATCVIAAPRGLVRVRTATSR